MLIRRFIAVGETVPGRYDSRVAEAVCKAASDKKDLNQSRTRNMSRYGLVIGLFDPEADSRSSLESSNSWLARFPSNNVCFLLLSFGN